MIKTIIDDELIKNRTIFLEGEINSESANEIIKKVIYLDSLNKEPISLYISSPGGSVLSGMAIIDTLSIIESKVKTVAIGLCASMATIILMNGDERYATRHSEIMIHDIFSEAPLGKEIDIKRSLKKMTKHRNMIIDLFKSKTKKNEKEIEEAISYDNYMSSDEAKEFGIIDKIIG
ncbi:MAG: ATP-dependent Clp protease proteolytic subunit [Bacilli bacterium]|nr:ATP-dependent Clp protease proteolytic subunit [Bacilli bacterium]